VQLNVRAGRFLTLFERFSTWFAHDLNPNWSRTRNQIEIGYGNTYFNGRVRLMAPCTAASTMRS
jgi:hypothetical protein